MPSAEAKAADGSILKKRTHEKPPKDSPAKRTRRASVTRTSTKNPEDSLPADRGPAITVETTETPPKKFDEPTYVDSELDKVAREYHEDKNLKMPVTAPKRGAAGGKTESQLLPLPPPSILPPLLEPRLFIAQFLSNVCGGENKGE